MKSSLVTAATQAPWRDLVFMTLSHRMSSWFSFTRSLNRKSMTVVRAAARNIPIIHHLYHAHKHLIASFENLSVRQTPTAGPAQSPFFHYNSTFAPQEVMHRHAALKELENSVSHHVSLVNALGAQLTELQSLLTVLRTSLFRRLTRRLRKGHLFVRRLRGFMNEKSHPIEFPECAEWIYDRLKSY
jgi:hypothetical protein